MNTYGEQVNIWKMAAHLIISGYYASIVLRKHPKTWVSAADNPTQIQSVIQHQRRKQ